MTSTMESSQAREKPHLLRGSVFLALVSGAALPVVLSWGDLLTDRPEPTVASLVSCLLLTGALVSLPFTVPSSPTQLAGCRIPLWFRGRAACRGGPGPGGGRSLLRSAWSAAPCATQEG